MKKMTILNNQEITVYKRDGFLIKKKFFDENETMQLKKWVDDYQKRSSSDWSGKENAYYETSLLDQKSRILSRIEKFTDFHSGLKNMANSPILLQCLNEIVGEDCILFKEKINLKQPGGNGFRTHQDIVSRWDDFASYFINVFVTIDECTIENGCLEIAKGFTKQELITEYDTPIDENLEKEMNFVPCLTSPGDVIFFDCFIPHRSKANLSQNQRRNMYLTYNKKSEGDKRIQYYERKEKEMPPDDKRSNDTFKDSPIHMAMYKTK